MLQSILGGIGSNFVLGASLGTAALSAGYIYWKSKGGQLLFRDNPKDDPTTRFFNAILGFAWAYTSVMVAMGVGAAAIVVTVINLVARLFA